MTSEASWFASRRRKHRHHKHRRKQWWRALLKYVMPVIVCALAGLTGWQVLKVFFFDRRAKSKPPPAAAQPAATNAAATSNGKALAVLDAELHAGDAAPDPQAGDGRLTSEPLLDPGAVVSAISNRLRADARRAPATTNASGAGQSAGQSATNGSGTGTSDLVLDPNEAIQKLAERKAARPAGSPEAGADGTSTNEPGQEALTDSRKTAIEEALNADSKSPAAAAPAGPSERDKNAIARALMDKAMRLYGSGDLIGAQVACEQVLNEAPHIHAARNILGEVHARLRKFDKAQAEFEWAIQAAPDNSEYHNNLALVLSQMDRNKEAEEQFVQAAKLDPLNTVVLMNCGWHFRKVKNYAEALKYFEQVLVVNPGHAQAKNKRIQTLLDLGQYDRVEQLIKDEFTAQPNGMQPHMMMAVLQTRRGNVTAAIEWLRRAEQLTTRANLRKLLETVDDFHSITNAPEYKSYVASLKEE